MEQKLSEAISNFSKKLARFSSQPEQERRPVHTSDEKLQVQINEREDRMKAAVLATYKIYKSPFEALGKDSNRAKIIDEDEQNLLRAYNLYKAVCAANSEKSDEHTFLKNIEISTPLAEKYAYTTGGQFVYLLTWLFYEQNAKEFIPEFFETQDGKFVLKFYPAEKYEFDAKTKETAGIIKENFYEGM